MKLARQILSKKIPSTVGGNLILRDQLSQHHVLLIFFPFAFEPNSVVNLTQLQARLEDLREWDYLPIGVCPENIFALNFLALSLDIDFPLISDYSLKLSDELGLRLEGDTDYSPKVCDAVIAIGRQGEVDYTYCSESRETDFDLDYIIDNLPQKRCDYCDGQ